MIELDRSYKTHSHTHIVPWYSSSSGVPLCRNQCLSFNKHFNEYINCRETRNKTKKKKSKKRRNETKPKLSICGTLIRKLSLLFSDMHKKNCLLNVFIVTLNGPELKASKSTQFEIHSWEQSTQEQFSETYSTYESAKTE